MKKSVDENLIDGWVKESMASIKFSSQEAKQMLTVAQGLKQSFALELIEKENGLKLQIDSLKSRLSKLTDLLLDDTIQKEVYNQKRDQYVIEIKTLESEINDFKNTKSDAFDRLEELATLLGNPVQAYELANPDNKANLIRKMMKNLKLLPVGVKFEWKTPFLALYNRKNELLNSSFHQGVPTGS